jgi:hypothetical protein
MEDTWLTLATNNLSNGLGTGNLDVRGGMRRRTRRYGSRPFGSENVAMFPRVLRRGAREEVFRLLLDGERGGGHGHGGSKGVSSRGKSTREGAEESSEREEKDHDCHTRHLGGGLPNVETGEGGHDVSERLRREVGGPVEEVVEFTHLTLQINILRL